MVSLQTHFLSIYYGTVPCNFCPFFVTFLQLVNIEPLRISPVHRWRSPVVKSIKRNSLVVKWETPYSPVHMNAALHPRSMSLSARHSPVITLFLHSPSAGGTLSVAVRRRVLAAFYRSVVGTLWDLPAPAKNDQMINGQCTLCSMSLTLYDLKGCTVRGFLSFCGFFLV